MALFATTSDLLEYMEQQSGELDDGTSPVRDQALSLLNRAHKTVVAGGGVELNEAGDGPEIFHWAKSTQPKVLILETKVTGTVTATLDSTTLTFSAGPANSLAGWHIKVGTDDTIYRITSHTAGNTSATIDSAYVSATQTATYVAFKLDYQLTNILMLSDEIKTFRKNAGGSDQILITSKETLDDMYPLTGISEDFPCMAGILALDTTGQLTIRLNSYPSRKERVELDYVPVPSALDTSSSNPILPPHHNLILAELGLYYYQLGLDDDRAAAHLANAKRMWKGLCRENQAFQEIANEEYGRLAPLESDNIRVGQVLPNKHGFLYRIFD